VHWPTRQQIVVYTFVVLVFVAFMVALVAGLDWAFAKAVFALFG
jgi:preprotein translocase subunit SecE